MSIMTCASYSSLWNGYEYFASGKVNSLTEIDKNKFQAKVSGSNEASYDVYLDSEHIRKSHCNCPHANGRRIICKHIVALFFSVFPTVAHQYKTDVDDCARKQEEYCDQLEAKIIKYVKSLSKSELQQKLLEVLSNSSEWVFNRFVEENIGDTHWR